MNVEESFKQLMNRMRIDECYTFSDLYQLYCSCNGILVEKGCFKGRLKNYLNKGITCVSRNTYIVSANYLNRKTTSSVPVEKPNSNDPYKELVVKLLQDSFNNNLNKILSDICKDILPTIVKEEFNANVAPAIKQLINDKIESIGVKNDLKDKLLPSLTRIVADITNGEYVCVHKDNIYDIEQDL